MKIRLPKMRLRFCKWCGIPFMAGHHEMQYCTESCLKSKQSGEYAEWVAKQVEDFEEKRQQVESLPTELEAMICKNGWLTTEPVSREDMATPAQRKWMIWEAEERLKARRNRLKRMNQRTVDNFEQSIINRLNALKRYREGMVLDK